MKFIRDLVVGMGFFSAGWFCAHLCGADNNLRYVIGFLAGVLAGQIIMLIAFEEFASKPDSPDRRS